MEKEETDRETSEDEVVGTVPPHRSIVWALALLVGGVSLLGWFSDWAGGPTSNGMTVSEWLNATNRGHVQRGKTVSDIEAFGSEAVPLFIAEFKHAVSGERPDQTLIQKCIPALGRPRVNARMVCERSFVALSILGRKYPDLVDPFFTEQLLTTNRFEAILWMGNCGSRHIGFLTNLIAGANLGDADAAIQALGFMGTNAQTAVPLVFSTLEKFGSAGSWDLWANLMLIPKIGKHHHITLPTLLSMLEHTNDNARRYSNTALLKMTNSYDRIRPEFIRLASQAISATNDPGRYVATGLYRLGVPPEVVVPILKKRLEYMIELDGHIPHPRNQTSYWLGWMTQYGTNAAPAIPLIEQRVLAHIPDRPRGGPQRALLEDIQHLLKRIDPTWLRPPNPLSEP